MKNLTELIRDFDQAEKLFEQAAKSWIRGNNANYQAYTNKCHIRCDKLRDQAEKILSEYEIKCDYPGLYPSFNKNGVEYSSLKSIYSCYEVKEV